MKKIYLLSLGCPRNLVDSEILMALLKKNNFEIVEDPLGADIAIVNTCGFIQSAKEESIDTILQLADFKKTGKVSKLIVTGCLTQRYPDELMDKIKEIDAVFGSSDFTKIPDIIKTFSAGKRSKEVSGSPSFLYDHTYEREFLTPPHYSYVKIQEGCSNNCSYCVIPQLKGPRRSRDIESILKEITVLKEKYDTKEIILIGQDTTSFGVDKGGASLLPELLKKASAIMRGRWIRLLYTHPQHFTDELIDVIANEGNICKYIDLPIQHVADSVLKRMNRGSVTQKGLRELIGKIRGKIKDSAIRTSVIVGFPGETEKDFTELMDFLKETKFERLGAFLYSREENTPAARLKPQIPEDVKEARFNEIMRLQQQISAENNLKFIDKKIKVLVDERDESDPNQLIARSQYDAPEVDGIVYVETKKKSANPGDLIDVKITGTMEYDLIGEII